MSEDSAQIDGPGWADHSMVPLMGLFPLAVEQFLKAQVAINAPGATTVTSTARYCALHGLVADEAQRRSLTDAEARDLPGRLQGCSPGLGLDRGSVAM